LVLLSFAKKYTYFVDFYQNLGSLYLDSRDHIVMGLDVSVKHERILKIMHVEYGMMFDTRYDCKMIKRYNPPQ